MQKYTNENQSRKQRSTSVKEIKNESTNLNQSEKENTNNNNTNYKKGFHHRKRTSSYFLGSYIPNSNILENNQLNEDDININLNINSNLCRNNNDILNDRDEETTSNELKNKFISNLINNDNSNNNISISFPSYDENNINNNSLVIKQDDSSNKKNNIKKDNNNSNNKSYKYDKNNIFYEMAKNSEISGNCKSFISFKNSLKYLKDKDERTTPSYQLALQTDKKNSNNNYVTSSNIIEEEKSSMLESKSEFSNKKEFFLFEKKKLENNKDEKLKSKFENKKDDKNIKDNKENNIKNILEKNKENNVIKNIQNNNIIDNNNNINNNNVQIGENNRMSMALNEIIIKNNKKEENRRNNLTKNKMTLLNTFFTMSKTLQMNELKNNNKNKIENFILHKEKEKEKDKDKNKEYTQIKIDKNNIDYYTKKKFVSKFLKKSFNNKRISNNNLNSDNAYLNSMQNLNNNLNLNYQEKVTINSLKNQENNDNIENIINNNNNLKKNSFKIPHLSNVKKKFQQKLMNDSCSNIIDTPFKKLKTTNPNNSSSRKGSLKGKTNLINERNFHTLKRMENLNNALSFIREKKNISKTNSNIDKKKYIINNTCNYSSNKNNKASGYSASFLTNSNTNTNNTQSHSQSKEKNKIPSKFLRKANSGSFNSKGEYLSQNGEEITNIESNKNQIIICLKYKLSFNKLYEKIDALEKINSTNFSNKSFFLILCDNKINKFIFSGLFKYYHDKERYIKIYGDERSPNYILLKDIKGRIKYKIFEDNNQINSSISSFILINHFRFTSNAVIIIKN